MTEEFYHVLVHWMIYYSMWVAITVDLICG